MVCLTCSTVATSSDIKRGTGWVRLSGVRLEAKTNPNDKVTPMQIAGRSIPLPEQIQDFLRTEHVTRYERELYYFVPELLQAYVVHKSAWSQVHRASA